MEYLRMFPKTARVAGGDAIPHEAVGLTIKKGYALARAWREDLGLIQKLQPTWSQKQRRAPPSR
jgi:hypothetical protein